jgi:hypothetical protein
MQHQALQASSDLLAPCAPRREQRFMQQMLLGVAFCHTHRCAVARTALPQSAQC